MKIDKELIRLADIGIAKEIAKRKAQELTKTIMKGVNKINETEDEEYKRNLEALSNELNSTDVDRLADIEIEIELLKMERLSINKKKMEEDGNGN